MKWRHNLPKSEGHIKSSPKRKVYSAKCLHQKIERSQINDLLLHLKALGVQEQMNPKSCTCEEIFKIQAEINELELK